MFILSKHKNIIEIHYIQLMNQGNKFPYVMMKYRSKTLNSSVITYFLMSCLFSDDDDRDIQADRAVDYGKRHQAIDIL